MTEWKYLLYAFIGCGLANFLIGAVKGCKQAFCTKHPAYVWIKSARHNPARNRWEYKCPWCDKLFVVPPPVKPTVVPPKSQPPFTMSYCNNCHLGPCNGVLTVCENPTEAKFRLVASELKVLELAFYLSAKQVGEKLILTGGSSVIDLLDSQNVAGPFPEFMNRLKAMRDTYDRAFHETCESCSQRLPDNDS